VPEINVGVGVGMVPMVGVGVGGGVGVVVGVGVPAGVNPSVDVRTDGAVGLVTLESPQAANTSGSRTRTLIRVISRARATAIPHARRR
jgi:hypothetical protein